MKLLQILTEKGNQTFEFQDQVEIIKRSGGKFIACGDYGCVYEKGGKAVKVTTDEVEIEHAIKLKGRSTEHFVKILDVNQLEHKLAVITMEKLIPVDIEKNKDKYKGWHQALKKEALSLQIDPSELDIRPDNIMQDPQTGRMKLIDV
jgi:hypothetical protein